MAVHQGQITCFDHALDEELWICATEMIRTAGIETEGEFDPSMHFFFAGAYRHFILSIRFYFGITQGI